MIITMIVAALLLLYARRELGALVSYVQEKDYLTIEDLRKRVARRYSTR